MVNMDTSGSLGVSRAPEIISSVLSVAILATIAVVLRLISRKLKKMHLSASDYTSVLGLVGAWVMCVDVIVRKKYFSVLAFFMILYLDNMQRAKYIFFKRRTSA